MTDEPTQRMISWPPDMPGFEVDALKVGRWWHVTARRDDMCIVGIGRTHDEALAAVRQKYLERDAWPFGHSGTCWHRGKDDILEANWVHRHDTQWTKMPKFHAVLQPRLDPLQHIDRAARRAGRWIGPRWQQALALIVFAFIVVATFAAYGHWTLREWWEVVR